MTTRKTRQHRIVANARNHTTFHTSVESRPIAQHVLIYIFIYLHTVWTQGMLNISSNSEDGSNPTLDRHTLASVSLCQQFWRRNNKKTSSKTYTEKKYHKQPRRHIYNIRGKHTDADSSFLHHLLFVVYNWSGFSEELATNFSEDVLFLRCSRLGQTLLVYKTGNNTTVYSNEDYCPLSTKTPCSSKFVLLYLSLFCVT